MGLKVITAYINGGVQYVRLSKEIKMLEAEKLIIDAAALKKALDKAKVKYPETIGVSVAENVLIRYLPVDEKGKLRFEGIIWSARQSLSGTYDLYGAETEKVLP